MANASEYFKMMAQREDNRFFGEGNKQKVSNKYFTFKHALDDDNIIIVTNNVKSIKGSSVLIVGSNKAVYLKEWQIRPAHNWSEIGEDVDLVKLSRQYFKVYTFKSNFEGFCFEQDETFDDLLETARLQDERNMAVANGYMNF